MRNLFLALILAGAQLAAHAAELPPLPPLTDPPSGEQLPGKFVWSDLFSSDIEANRRFYGQLFGWEWRWISQPPQPYGMFYLDGIPVAGLAHRAAPEGKARYGRWVNYISVSDAGDAEAAVVESGGQSLMPTRTVDERGDLSIVADPQGAIVGLLRSSSGDPGDFRAEHGEFIWFQLFTRELDPAASFYQDLFGYDIVRKADSPDIVHYILQTEHHSRAGIGALEKDSETRPTWLGYIRVEDVAATVKRVEELGGEVLLAPSAANLDGDMAIVADPTGSPFGLLRWDYPDWEETQ
jgi:predicted enzyme related to lactoylglutathione lyase